jgi:hypothetical protein
VNFRQRTPFPSGAVARRTIGRDTHAWQRNAAMGFQSAGIRKRGVGGAGMRELNSARKPKRAEVPQPKGVCNRGLERPTTAGGPSGRRQRFDRLPASAQPQT